MLPMLGAVFLICIYGQMRCKLNFFDPLSTKLGLWDLDGWSITHFILFFVSGRLFPRKRLLLFFYGVLWEAVEHFLGRSRPTWLGGWASCEDNANKEYIDGWWFGRASDLLVNALGLLLSSF